MRVVFVLLQLLYYDRPILAKVLAAIHGFERQLPEHTTH